MNKKERIMAAIAGEPVDTVPMSFWMPVAESEGTPEEAAERAYQFSKTWDLDLTVTVNGSGYSAEDYVAPDYEQNGGLRYIKRPEDWMKIGESSVNGGALLREQESLKLLLEKEAGERPVVFRVLSPLATASLLAVHLWEDVRRGGGNMVKEALKAITETTCALVQRVIELGADGIFFEAPLADYEIASESFYREYGAPYDMAVLSASQGWCNIVRGGGTNCMFSLLRKYPAQIFTWDAAQSLPTLEEVRDLTGTCAMAGLSRRHLEFDQWNYAEYDIYRTLKETGGRRLILSAGAAVQPHPGMAETFLRSKREIEGKLRMKN